MPAVGGGRSAAPPPSRALTTGANPRGVAIDEAVQQVFHAQPPTQQRAILRGAQRTPASRVSQAVFRASRFPLSPRAPQNVEASRPGTSSPGSLLGDVGKGIVGGVDWLRGATQLGSNGPGNVASFGNLGQKVAHNAASDLVNLPGEAISTVGTVGKDIATGKPGKALNDVVGPYVSLVEHPAQSFIQHPLLTALMVTGAVHGATRLGAAPVRGLVPGALSTEREGVALTGKLTHERPPFSKSPTIARQQKAIDNSLYTRAPTGELIPRSEQLRRHQLNQGVGELVGTRERIRATNRQAIQVQREAAVRPSRAVRVAHGMKTALAYDPKQAVIPGANVLARIADATVRRPDTIEADLEKHLAQVSANRPNLLEDPQALKAHDAYVKQITAALKNKAFLRNPQAAFAASEAYAKDYAPVEAQAAKLGHFGDMTGEALQRRALMHYAATHMGARVDPKLGLVTDRPVAAGAASTVPHELSTQAILNHLNGPEGTRGRLPAFTSDRVRFDREKAARQANYVSSERRPLPARKGNQLYAYTHGLTNPGHEALTEQHVLMRGVVDAHHAQNAYLETLATQKPGGGYWDTFDAAKRDAPRGYVPVNVSQIFHPQGSLDKALQDVSPASIEEEAVRHSLDLSSRLQPGTSGRWAIIDEHALKVLRDHQNQISPNPLLRTIRGLNNQFRTVALSTSAKHIPGVVQENMIRAIAQGVGFRSWVTGRRLLGTAERMSPERGRELGVQLRGGQVAGMTEAGKTYLVSDHWAGTSVYPLLKAMEASFKSPGLRQMRTAWRAWTRLAIGGTKRALEEQMQTAALGKAALREHGYAEAARVDGFMGLVHRAFGLHGKMLDDAARGLFDPAKARQMRAVINQIAGKWTDLSPAGQTALMFSPFGLWWANSVRFLARMPVDQPVKTSLLSSATAGTQQERQAQGLDMLMPGALPLYEQGGIPLNGKILAQNYYSPFGVANNPLETGASLIQPWALPVLQGAGGVDYLWKPLTAPGQNTNRGNEKQPNVAQRAQYVLDSVLASFVPLYTKAAQITEGGASPYDVSGNSILPPLVRGHAPATKQPGKGFLAGLRKATLPVREYRIPSASTGSGYVLGSGSGATSSGYVLGSSGSSGGSGYVLGSGG